MRTFKEGFYKIDRKLVERNVMPFAQALKGGEGKSLTFQRGRFSPRAYCQRSTEGFFSRKQYTNDGVPKVTLIVDCSGSMSGPPMLGAVQMCAVMNRLHDMGLIKAVILLTGYCGGGKRENGFKVPLPQPEWVWTCLSARHGCEGISQTFKSHMDEIRESVLVTCYTDANIVDEALEPSLWRKHGVSCMGLYVGDQAQHTVMSQYFDKTIVRSDVQDLFTSYLGLVGSIIKTNR